MDTPTKVLTIGIGALAAVAAYLGWQNSTETPEIIDSEVHDYDSKVKQKNKTKVAGAFSNNIESDEETQGDVWKEDTEPVKKETEPVKEETEPVKEVRAEVKAEVKQHMNKLPYESPWGTFWRSEYDEIAKEESSN